MGGTLWVTRLRGLYPGCLPNHYYFFRGIAGLKKNHRDFASFPYHGMANSEKKYNNLPWLTKKGIMLSIKRILMTENTMNTKLAVITRGRPQQNQAHRTTGNTKLNDYYELSSRFG